MYFVILAIVGYQCKVVFSLVIVFCLVIIEFFVDFSTSSEVVFFFTKFSNGKILREILVLGSDRYCFIVLVAENRLKIGGVFT